MQSAAQEEPSGWDKASGLTFRKAVGTSSTPIGHYDVSKGFLVLGLGLANCTIT